MRFFKSDPQELVSSIIFTKDDKEIKLLCSDGEIISFKDDDLKHQPLEKWLDQIHLLKTVKVYFISF